MQAKTRRINRPLLRVRTGCLTCRARKKKCDEGKPICMGCIRNQLQCRWLDDQQTRPPPPTNTYFSAPGSTGASASETTISNSTGPIITEPGSGLEYAPLPEVTPSELAPGGFQYHAREESEWQTLQPRCSVFNFDNFDSAPEEGLESPGWLVRESLATLNEMIPAHPEFMPQLDHSRFSLFGYYIQKTAQSMANGAAEPNPFLVQLIPLTVSSELVLESILVQSCAHRAAHTPSLPGSEAVVLYNKSLRSLRSAINNISAQENKDVLALIVSMLILCFTETARGDVTGSIFYHLQATSSLLPNALFKLKSILPKDLREFLIEYYIYTATLSMVSMAELSPQSLFYSGIMDEGQKLVESGYIGNLCGCWLSLLLLIPRIFHLGYAWRTQAALPATAEQVMTFAFIQSQVLQWEPSSHAPPDVALVGKIFKQALLVYLYGILNEPTLDKSDIHASSIQEAVTEAMLYLEQLPPSTQINTSLCWPLAVIGTCVLCPQQQQCIRIRLKIMAEKIGLGNISKTRELLEYVWSQARRGPWEISRAMQASQIWFSFA